MGTDQMETLIFEQFTHARQQMIVTTAIGRNGAGQHTETLEVGVYLPERRPHQCADEYDVAAACSARKPQELADLADMDPVMWKTLNGHPFCCAAQRKQHHRATTRRHSIRDRQRQTAPAAQHRERAFLSGGRRGVHASSSAPLRLIAMVSGRLALRINSMILPTSG
jgi:hypothetical protein